MFHSVHSCMISSDFNILVLGTKTYLHKGMTHSPLYSNLANLNYTDGLA